MNIDAATRPLLRAIVRLGAAIARCPELLDRLDELGLAWGIAPPVGEARPVRSCRCWASTAAALW